jgi:hypothetical protein
MPVLGTKLHLPQPRGVEVTVRVEPDDSEVTVPALQAGDHAQRVDDAV